MQREYNNTARLVEELINRTLGRNVPLYSVSFADPDLDCELEPAPDPKRLIKELREDAAQEPSESTMIWLEECLTVLSEKKPALLAAGTVGLMLAIDKAWSWPWHDRKPLSIRLLPTAKLILAGVTPSRLRSVFHAEFFDQVEIKEASRPVIFALELYLDRKANMSTSAPPSASELQEAFPLMKAWLRSKWQVRAFAFGPGGFACGSMDDLATGGLLHRTWGGIGTR